MAASSRGARMVERVVLAAQQTARTCQSLSPARARGQAGCHRGSSWAGAGRTGMQSAPLRVWAGFPFRAQMAFVIK